MGKGIHGCIIFNILQILKFVKNKLKKLNFDHFKGIVKKAIEDRENF